jgi:hypothetical protein
VSVALPPADTELGESVADTPAGAPDTDRLTVSAKPSTAVVTVTLVVPPGLALADADPRAIAKSAVAAGATMIGSVAVCVLDPSVPVTVTA